MNQVRVKKTELLEILKKNKAEHEAIFAEAQKTWQTAVVKELTSQLAIASENKLPSLLKLKKLEPPKSYASEYERAIGMLEMSVDDVVEIDQQEYQNYVRDIWNWSRNWAYSNSAYSNNPKLAAITSSDEL